MGSIRNKNGIWINTEVFREAARHFETYGLYCNELEGTKGFEEFWDEEERRCLEGYEVGGAKITGAHYFYLNYCPILRTADPNKTNKVKSGKRAVSRKKYDFPDFWDGDFEFFWIRQIAAYGIDREEFDSLHLSFKIKDSELSGGKHLIAGKARRKGFSFKNGALASHEYNFQRESLTMLLAFDKKYLYPKGIMSMAKHYCDFVNEHTDFSKQRLIDRVEHLKSGAKVEVNGGFVDKGYLSEIIAVSMSDNPDAARGKSGSLVIMEEAGAWPGMKNAYMAIKPLVEDGNITTGQIIIFGTGGDMKKGTVDYSEMFYNPEPYGLMAFDNIWDENREHTTCGYFWPAYQNYVGFVDSIGNSLKEEAIKSLDEDRQVIIKTSKDKTTLTKHCTEYPYCPAEAFAMSSGNIFPAADLYKQLNAIETSTDPAVTGIRGTLIINPAGKIDFEPDLYNRLRQSEFPTKENTIEGCVVIWEPPIANPPYGLYIAGTDPYTHSTTNSSNSVGSTYILRRATIGFATQDQIVAEYAGRPANLKEHNEIVRRLLMYYNATDLYENNVNNLKEYFETKNSLHLLAKSPVILKSTISGHLVNQYGLRMSKQIKDELEIYLRDWLLEQVNEEGLLNLHFIYSKPLLKELIQYNEDGNFDRAIALMLTICLKLQMHRVIAKQKEKIKIDNFFTRRFFT